MKQTSRHVVLATAGHIDHGKTELTRTLTGIDTDRLPEEKARGITIDLGFAHFELGGRQIAVVDVPGHERFVKNMLAGVGGVDVALLVIAADESVMPQTREHLAILELLGVARGVVALTKCDLVDDELRELAELDVVDFTRGTFLEGATIVAVSSRTGDGIDELRSALEVATAAVQPRDPSGAFRLHVDRAFSVKGFGAVVTGVVQSGAVRVGDAIAVEPGGEAAKVRGIEVHGVAADEAVAGSRAALNLAGVDLRSVSRGTQLVSANLFHATSLIDVELRLLGSAAPVKDMARVRVHLGAAEVLGRVKLIGRVGESIGPGESALVQLRLERPVLAWPGDRLVVRSYSPMVTIGGGGVLDVLMKKHKGAAKEALELLDRSKSAGPTERLSLLVAATRRRGLKMSELVARAGLLPGQVEALVEKTDLVRVKAADDRLFDASVWTQLQEEAREIVAAFHLREPLREGMSREELRRRLFREDASSAKRLLDDMVESGCLRLLNQLVALAEHRVKLSDAQVKTKDGLEATYRNAGLSPPSTKDVLAKAGPGSDDLLAVLIREGRLVAVPGGLHFHEQILEALRQRLCVAPGVGRPFTVAEFKEITGTSRKYAIPLLEYLDASRVTERRGDSRVVREPATPSDG